MGMEMNGVALFRTMIQATISFLRASTRVRLTLEIAIRSHLDLNLLLLDGEHVRLGVEQVQLRRRLGQDRHILEWVLGSFPLG